MSTTTDEPTTAIATRDPQHVQVTRAEQSLAGRVDDVSQAIDSINESTPVEQLLHLDKLVKCLGAIARDFAARLKARKLEWIPVNGDIDLGNGKREYVGTDTDVEVPNPDKVLRQLCEGAPKTVDTATGEEIPDYAVVAQYLSSDPFKHGSVGKLWKGTEREPLIDKLFVRVPKPDVKTGVAKKTVKVFDPAFVR